MFKAIRRTVLVGLSMLLALDGAALAASPFERPGFAERELVSERTPVSRTWEMPSGRRVTQIASEPVQWRDAGGVWREYDLSLRQVAGGWSAQAGKAAVELPASLGGAADDAVRIGDGEGNSLLMAVLGEPASGSVRNDVAIYEGVARGVDVRFRAIPEGVKEEVVLEDREASRDLRYRFTVGADGMAVEEDGNGGLIVVRGETPVFSIPRPALWDAKDATALAGRYAARQVDERSWVVTTVLPERWLDDPDRAWPVVVDPTVTTFSSRANDDCTVGMLRLSDGSRGGPYGLCNMIDHRPIGIFPGSGYTDFRTQLLRFDTLTAVQTDVIESAELKLYRMGVGDPQPDIGIHRVGAFWNASTMPWTAGTTWAERTPTAVIAGGPVGPISADLTVLAREWRRYQDTSGTEGTANRGVLVNPTGWPIPNPSTACSGGCSWPHVYRPGIDPPAGYSQGAAILNSSLTPPPTSTPLLEVTSWPGAAAGNAVISPGEGDLVGKRVRLQARALSSSVTSVRFQYLAGAQRRWADVPLAALKTPTRGTVSSLDIPVSGPTGDRRSDLVVWDLSAMAGGEVDGPVHVRAWLESATAGQGGMTDQVNFRLDRRGIDTAPTVPVGPGELSLLSGEFSLTESDFATPAFLQDLTLSRTYRSRGVSVRNADMFGPGWEASVEADGGELPYKGIYNYSEVRDVVTERQYLDPYRWNWELFFETFDIEDLQPDIETMQETESFNYEYLVVEAADGTKMTFTQVKDSSGRVTDWTPDDLHPGFTLRRDATGTANVFEITLTDPSGNVAKFRSEVASSPNYRLVSFQQPGSTQGLSYTYEASGTRQRLKKVTAPAPWAGVARSLIFNWAQVGRDGYAAPRVTTVQLNDGSGMLTFVAAYGYDDQARLVVAVDPRVPNSARNTAYHYNGNGQLDQVTPSGEATWNLAYTTIAGDSGPRLASVRRAHPDGGTATQTIRYDVPLSGSEAPNDMSVAETAKWGQTDDLPWDAVAIWPEDTVPDPEDPDYAKATVYYLGLQGLTVNVAAPGGAIETLEHDARGNVIRELGAQGRADALAAGASSATVAADRSTLYQYARHDVDLVATREPVTQITLADGSVVRGRRLTTINYDENAPTGGPYHLPTSKWRAVDVAGRLHDVKETVRYQYDGFGGMSGWRARHATKTIVDPGGRALTSHSILHGTHPIVEETRTPGAPSGGTTPDVQWHVYFGVIPTRVPLAPPAYCESYDYYEVGQLCMRSQSGASPTSVPRRWYRYSRFGQVTMLTESKDSISGDWEYPEGTSTRLTMSDYDGAGQVTWQGVYVEGTSVGVETPATTHTYDPATGNRTQTSSSTGTIRRAFDSNGRVSSYTDASGTVTTYRHDLRGRKVSMTVDGVTTSYGYDDRDNRTSVNDPGIGAEVRAGYDLDDQLASESLPNGLVMTQIWDETGRPALLSWTQTRDCSRDCTWARSEATRRDPDGRIVEQRTNTTQEILTYDSAGRLSRSDATRLSDNRCVRRTYTYDGGGAGDSNRTSTSTWTSRPGDACGTGTPTTRDLTYDTADRITASGWRWDYFGRATDVPAADSGGTGALAATYFTDDFVESLTLDGRTHAYERDALRRTQRIASSGASKPASTIAYRYSDDSDRPTRITNATDVTRDIAGPSGLVIASALNGRPIYQLRDIQGSIVGTAPASGTPTAGTEYDPFGIVATPASNVIDWTLGLPANGWLGAYQRPTQFGQDSLGAAGPIEMGARVYLPKIGRFLQVDPIDGASWNAYDYAWQDPSNMIDLDGRGPLDSSLGSVMRAFSDWISPARTAAQAVVNRCLSGWRSGVIGSFAHAIWERANTPRERDEIRRARLTIRNTSPRSTGPWKVQRQWAIRTLTSVVRTASANSLWGVGTSCVLGGW